MNKNRRPFKYTGYYYRRLKKENIRLRGVLNDKNIPAAVAAGGFLMQIDEQIECDDVGVPQIIKTESQEAVDAEDMQERIPDVNILCSDNSSSDDDDGNTHFSAKEDLRNLLLRNNITHQAATDKLKYLNKYNVIGLLLPSDIRSFLSTPSSVQIETIGNGQFFYKGISKCIEDTFHDCLNSIPIRPFINVDGLPLHNSTKKEFWPILMAIDNMPKKGVMVVAIFTGEAKPNVVQYFGKFVEEMNFVIKNGIHLKNNVKLTIIPPFFICDSPARCHIKGKYEFLISL